MGGRVLSGHRRFESTKYGYPWAERFWVFFLGLGSTSYGTSLPAPLFSVSFTHTMYDISFAMTAFLLSRVIAQSKIQNRIFDCF